MSSRIFVRSLVVVFFLVFAHPGFAQKLKLIGHSNEPLFVNQKLTDSLDFERAGRLKLHHRTLSTLVDQIRRQRDIPEIQIKLFDDVDFTVITEDVRRAKNDGYIWKGHINDHPNSWSLFIIRDNRLTGNIQVAGTSYSVGTSEGNVLVVTEQNLLALPPDEPPDFEQEAEKEMAEEALPEENSFTELSLNVGEPVELRTLRTRDFQKLTRDRSTLEMLDHITHGSFVFDGYQCNPSQKTVDVMVVYTDAAEDYYTSNGRNIENQIDLAVETVNQSYIDSGIEHRINLVHTVKTDYTEGRSTMQDRTRLKRKNDGHMDDIHQLRDQYNADLVAYWGYDTSKSYKRYCGYAYIMTKVSGEFEDHAFSATRTSCVSNLTFAHEMGHNMGARHDWRKDKSSRPYKYSHGYVNDNDPWSGSCKDGGVWETVEWDGWRTVMAYDCDNNDCAGCPRQPYWSNPNNTYSATGSPNFNPSPPGHPMGVPESDRKPSENYQTLNNTMPVVATFRNLLGTNESKDEFGSALASGDFNGDGYLDLAVGAPGESPGSDPESGYVFVYRGGPCGLSRWHSLGQANGALTGTNEKGDEFGTSLAAGDFDGDGKDDLAVGAPGESPGSDPESGWVFVYRGSSSGLSGWDGLGQSGLGANEKGDEFGTSLAAGDFDGDGKDDLAVGAPGESPGSDPESGFTFVYIGDSAGPTAWQGLDQED